MDRSQPLPPRTVCAVREALLTHCGVGSTRELHSTAQHAAGVQQDWREWKSTRHGVLRQLWDPTLRHWSGGACRRAELAHRHLHTTRRSCTATRDTAALCGALVGGPRCRETIPTRRLKRRTPIPNSAEFSRRRGPPYSVCFSPIGVQTHAPIVERSMASLLLRSAPFASIEANTSEGSSTSTS